MKTTGSIFDYIQIGLIASGGDPSGQGQKKGDFPSDSSTNQKVILPQIHDPDNVKQEHLAFSPMLHSPTGMSHVSFPGVLDPGAQVYFLKMPGENGGVILGQANDLINYDKGGGGGQNLLSQQYFQDLFNREMGINIPPEIKETTEDGAKVKVIKEKDKYHKHALLKGLPHHNAMQPTTGYKLEEVKEIPTGRQFFDALPTEQMMAALPGAVSSLAGMFQGLMGGNGGGAGGGGAGAGAGAGGGGGTSSSANNIVGNVSFGAGVGTDPGQITNGSQTPMDRIQQSLQPEIFDALMSLSTLTQGVALSDATAFVIADRVHTPTYLSNAEQLLSQVTTLEDLFTTIHRLQYDKTLFGQENLSNNIIAIDTAWGNANISISFAGDINLSYANSNTQNTYVENMMSPDQSPSSGGGSGGGSTGGAGGGGNGKGGNMFGQSASLMQDMFKRLAPNNQKEAKNMHQKLNQDDLAQKLWKFAQTTINGGNPIDPKNFT